MVNVFNFGLYPTCLTHPCMYAVFPQAFDIHSKLLTMTGHLQQVTPSYHHFSSPSVPEFSPYVLFPFFPYTPTRPRLYPQLCSHSAVIIWWKFSWRFHLLQVQHAQRRGLDLRCPPEILWRSAPLVMVGQCLCGLPREVCHRHRDGHHGDFCLVFFTCFSK